MSIEISLNNIEIEYLIDLIETDREISKGFSKHKTSVVEKLVKKLTIHSVVGRIEQLCEHPEDERIIKALKQ